ncbi:MAG: hypothetical protein AB1454_13265 [Candidatus Auribacterota bacterium]
MISPALFTVFVLMIMSLIPHPSFAQQNNTPNIPDTIFLEANATFESSNICPALSSTLSGSTGCTVYYKSGNELNVKLRIETGNEPTGLFMAWKFSCNRKIPDLPGMPFVFAASDTTQDTLLSWLKMRTRKDPSLILPLSLQYLDNGTIYTNLQAITGKAFIIDNSTDKISVQEYAAVTIPAGAISLTRTGSDNMDKTGISISSSSIILDNIDKQLFRKHLIKHEIRGRSFSMSSADFVAVQRYPVESELFVSSVSSLEAVLTDLYSSGLGTPSAIRASIRQLAQVELLQRKAQTVSAVSAMVLLEKSLEEMAENGDIPVDSIHLLESKTTLVLNNLVKANFTVSDLTVTLSPPISLASAVWYVNQAVTYPHPDGTTKPDGSDSHPFVSIVQAFEAADGLSVKNLTLYVHAGVYSEPLLISRNTTLNAISGEMVIISGAIVNLSASSLNITGFYLVGADGPGAVFVSHSDAKTSIADTVVQDATRFGIYQYGGSLTLNDVAVYRTHTEPSQQIFGTGICLRGGVNASLNDVISDRNESFGIYAEGPDTNLIAARVTVNENILNPLFRDDYEANPNGGIFFGGIAVLSDASAAISVLRMAQNEGSGIIAQGASVLLADVTINDTHNYEPEGGWTGGITYGGGTAVWARNGGYLCITNFLITRSSLAGVMISVGGEMDLSYGEVSYNTIGAVIFDETFDYTRLTNYVRYKENGTNLQSVSLPIPDPGL